MLCPCGGEITVSLSHSGGCYGHGPVEYCYCSSAGIEVIYGCTTRWCRDKSVHNRLPSDEFGLERMLAAAILAGIGVNP